MRFHVRLMNLLIFHQENQMSTETKPVPDLHWFHYPLFSQMVQLTHCEVASRETTAFFSFSPGIMLSAQDMSRVAIGLATGFTGICLNSMIVAVNLSDWHGGIILSSCDLVLSLIGLINVLFQTDLVLEMIFRAFRTYIKLAIGIHLRILQILVFLASCNYWFTVLLCTYYCLRIINFSSGLLFLLKMRISTYLPKLLVMLAGQSFCIAVPAAWTMYLVPPHELVVNTSSSQEVITITFTYKVILMCGTITPLILTLIPTVLTLNSLWRHIMMMKKNMLGSSTARTHAHVTAARTMVLLLTLLMSFYISSISIILHSFNVEDVSQHFSWFVIFSFSTLQAIIIIHGNSKLRTSANHIINQPRNWYLTLHGNHPGSEVKESTSKCLGLNQKYP
ncbi:taste receptor type 2 member 40-like [Phyllobates terribilis]|uniref:taste receptor type 2 member 40-like n=1 Tax=Phyllobates terribilis TaxID=111132 RepID=UPI003CCB003E